MYQKPKSAKKLFFDVIPKNVDNYSSFLKKFESESELDQYINPVWHIHAGIPPKSEDKISFNMLMNLVGVCNSKDKNVIWNFLKKYDDNHDSKTNKGLDKLIEYAINYYIDFILPFKKYQKINDENRKIFEDLLYLLKNIDKKLTSEEIQTQIYNIGKKHNFSNLRDFFILIYQVLLGQNQGPRLGSFIKMYGILNTCKLIDKVLTDQDLEN